MNSSDLVDLLYDLITLYICIIWSIKLQYCVHYRLCKILQIVMKIWENQYWDFFSSIGRFIRVIKNGKERIKNCNVMAKMSIDSVD